MTTKTELLNQIREASVELASYTSYSEIVGAISYNRPAIRKYCDLVFDLNGQLALLEDAEAVEEFYGHAPKSILERASEKAFDELQLFRDATRPKD